MTDDEVLCAYRLRVLATARELGSAAAACRLHGIHRATFHPWKAMAERFGVEILPHGKRRRPQRPNSILMLTRAARRGLRSRPRELRPLCISASSPESREVAYASRRTVSGE